MSHDHENVLVKIGKGSEFKVPGPLSLYEAVIPNSIEKLCDNLVDMEIFNEAVILYQVFLALFLNLL